MTSPASANGEQQAGVPKAAALTAKHRITLITGDRVVVDAKGRVVGLERAKGRAASSSPCPAPAPCTCPPRAV